MGGIKDFLFGKEEKTQMHSAPTMTGPQLDLLNQLAGLLGGQLGQGIEGYGGQMTADPTQGLQSLFSMIPGLAEAIGGVAGGMPGYINEMGSHVSGALGGFGESQDLAQNLLGGFGGQMQDILGQMGGMIPGLTGQIDPIMSQMRGGADMGLGYLSQLLGGDPQMDQQFFEQSVRAPAMQAWEQDIMPGILEQYAGMDALDSGASRRALAQGGANLATGMNQQMMDYILGQQNMRSGASQNLAGMTQGLPSTLMSGATGLSSSMLGNLMGGTQGILGSMMGSQTNMLSPLLGAQTGTQGNMMNLLSQLAPIAGSQYDISNQQTKDAYSQWAQQQPWSNPWLQQLGLALNQGPMENMAVTTGGSGGLLGGISGSLGSALGTGLGALIFSDRRLKENIVKVGERILGNGAKLNVYEFNYRDGYGLPVGTQLGHIAQEVMEAAPECCFRRRLDGQEFLAVNYGLLGRV
jgi:hypothetical protein